MTSPTLQPRSGLSRNKKKVATDSAADQPPPSHSLSCTALHCTQQDPSPFLVIVIIFIWLSPIEPFSNAFFTHYLYYPGLTRKKKETRMKDEGAPTSHHPSHRRHHSRTMSHSHPLSRQQSPALDLIPAPTSSGTITLTTTTTVLADLSKRPREYISVGKHHLNMLLFVLSLSICKRVHGSAPIMSRHSLSLIISAVLVFFFFSLLGQRKEMRKHGAIRDTSCKFESLSSSILVINTLPSINCCYPLVAVSRYPLLTTKSASTAIAHRLEHAAHSCPQE